MAAPLVAVRIQDFGEVGANRLGKGGLEGPGVLAVLLSRDPVQAIAPHIVFAFFTRTIGLVEGGLCQLLDCDDCLHVLPKCLVVQLEIVGHCILLNEVPELSLGVEEDPGVCKILSGFSEMLTAPCRMQGVHSGVDGLLCRGGGVLSP